MNNEFYSYSDEDRERILFLGLVEDDLGRYRGTRKEIHPVLGTEFIVIETRDGIEYRNGKDIFWSEAMLNHLMFSHLSTYTDESYLDYWFFAE